MTPAAILSILVRTQGVGAAAAELNSLDAAGKRAATGGVARSEKAAAKAGGAYRSAAKSVAGMVGAYVGFRAVKSSIDTTETLAKTTITLSRNYGLATKAASEWAAVGRARGLEGKQLTMGFKTLSKQVASAATGSKTAKKMFGELGLSQGELAKNGDNLQWVLNRVSDGLGRLPGGTKKAAIMGTLFGRSWQNIAPIIRNGSKSMREQLAVADKYGATFGGKSIKSLERMIVAQREAKLAGMGLQVTLGTTLIPVLTKVVGAVAKFVYGFRQGTGAGGQLRDALSKVGQALAPLVESVKQIVGWFSKQGETVKIVAAALAGLALAVWAVNAAMAANPIVLVIAGLAALTVALVTAYRESETFRAVLDAIAGAATAAATWVVGAFKAIVAAVSGAFAAVTGEVGAWKVLFDVVGGVVQAAVGIVGFQLSAMTTLVRVAMVAIGPIFAAGWKLVQGIFSGAWAIISGVVRGGFDVIRGIVKVIGGLLKGDFGQVWDGVKTIFSGAWTAIRGILSGAWKIIKAPIDAIKAGITDAFDKTFDRVGSIFSGAVKTITGFVNAIIDVINILPFVEIKHVGGGSKDYTKNAAGGKGKFGPNFAEGGKVTAPVAIMGEEAPRHPEWVIPTNPAYRGRAVGLWAAAAHDLGIPGFLLGGLHVPSPAKAFDFVSSLPGRVASAAGVGAKWLVDKLPGNPFGSGIFKGVGRYVLKEGGEWIRDAAGKVWGAATSFLGEGGGKTRGLVPQVLRALAFARRRGWAGAVSSGVRSRAEQAFLWNNAPALGLVRGVSVAKPGTSEHERGRAVDVTQWEAFRKIMAGAPASSRLLWRGPTDRVHFSVSGHRRGGLLRLAAGGRWSASDIAELGWKVGLRGNKDVLATAIALAESGGDPNARYRNKDGTIDRGLWQINSVHGALSTFGPLANARAMKKISKGGTNWRPWTKFRNRDYVDYLPRARRAVAALAKKQAASKKTTAATKVAAGVSGQENLFSAALTAAQVRTPVRKGQTPEEYTAAISDDLNVLKLWLKWAQGELDKAMTTGNAEAIQRFAPMVDTVGTQITDLASATPAVGHTYGEEPSAEDPALAALEANTAAIEEQNRLAASLDEAIRAQLAFARSVEGIAGYQAIKALSDIISGHIMGKGYAPRSRTASSGKVVSY